MKFTASIGMHDSVTGERALVRDIQVNATSEYEAHRLALLKCDKSEKEVVARVSFWDGAQKHVVYDYDKGFNP
jgi:hypothetical protein